MTEEEFRTGKGVEPKFDYMTECDKTCSTVFRPEQVELADMVSVLKAVAGFAEDLNITKKLLFRGKTRADVGLSEFEGNSLATVAPYFPPNVVDLLHGAIGTITEAGEIAEYLLHFIETGKFDFANAAEEAGDVGWYLVRTLRGLGITRDACDRMNIDKLRGRHGEAFDVFRDANRDLSAERAKLEDGFNKAAPATPLFDNVSVVKNPAEFSDDVDPASRDVLDEYHAKGAEAVIEAHGDNVDMFDRIREINNANSVTAISAKTPIGDCEGMDC